MPMFRCKVCGSEFLRRGKVPGSFCSMPCKAEWQRRQKPVDRDWLVAHYVDQGLSMEQIGVLVGRNPKQVYHWLKGYGIPTRTRGWSTEKDPSNPLHDPAWLRHEYVDRGRSAEDIGAQFGVTGANVLYHLKQNDVVRRSMSEARAIKHWGASGPDNPMYGKRGADVPNWKGGVTPERQAFYSSEAWAAVVKLVWRRDRGVCQRCGKKANDHGQFHIHHIVSFAVAALRAEPTNLVLLCPGCHRFVHSRKNVDREYIKDQEGGEENGGENPRGRRTR